MRKVGKFTFLLLLSLSILHLPIYSQSRENGAIQGRVTTDTGEFLPGAEVKVSSPNLIGGDRFAITNESGKFRFVALPPGTYSVTATLEGFTPAKIEDIRLHVGTTLTADLVLKVGGLTEEIFVVGEAPLVDVKDSQIGTANLPIEYLQNIPNSQFSTDIVNLAPGVTNDVAYGGTEWTSISWHIDGVDVSDPGDGGGVIKVDYNVIEEAKIFGIGAPAEYDGFSGAVFNIVSKSGGNELKGDFNFLYQNGSWNSDNTGDTGLSIPPATSFFDISTHLGGPIIKDKLWFFAGLEYYSRERQQPDFPKARTYKEPKFFAKFTWQPNKNNRFQTYLEYDRYWRDYLGGGPRRAIEVTTDRKRYTVVWNLSWLHIFSDKTFLEAKYSGWAFESHSTPKGGDLPGHIDQVTKWQTVNTTGYLEQIVHVNNANLAVSHHADNFLGSHDFKFGLELRISDADEYVPIPGGRYYLDYNGQSFYMYAFEGLNNLIYNVQPRNQSYSGFAQDSWSVTDNLTINFGLRLNSWRSKLLSRPEEKYKTTGFAPRIGFSYDLFGDHSTAFKAHYGRYFDALTAVSFYPIATQNADFVGYTWEDGNWVEVFREPGNLPDGTTPTSMDPDIKHPCIDQFSIGISRELAKDLSFEISYINRVSKNIIDIVNLNAEYEKILRTDPYTGATYEIYNQTNNPEDNRYMFTNPYAGQANSVLVDPTKKYNALQILLTKRFSNNWQMLASYVYSTLRGTYDNTYDYGMQYSRFYKDPNNQYNSDGKFTFDPIHMLKIQGMVALPLDINLSANFSLISGNNYTRYLRIGGLNQGAIDLFTEKKGLRRLPTKRNLDIRLEKVFNFGDRRFGLTFDIFNVFNEGRATWYISEAGEEFEAIDDIMDARGFRIGFRFFF